jgi:hypothetical protein
MITINQRKLTKKWKTVCNKNNTTKHIKRNFLLLLQYSSHYILEVSSLIFACSNCKVCCEFVKSTTDKNKCQDCGCDLLSHLRDEDDYDIDEDSSDNYEYV